MGPDWLSTRMEGMVSPASSELDPGQAAALAAKAVEDQFRRQREQLLLAEHAWAPGTEVMVSAGIDAGMRHLVGRVGRVRRCAWRGGGLMCELVLPPPPPMPVMYRDGRVSWRHLRLIDRIPTALWVPARALQTPPPEFHPPEGMSTP